MHHGGDAVAHGTLVAPAGRDGGGSGFRLWKGPPIHVVGARAHCGTVPVSLPRPLRPPCPMVGPFSGPREAPSGCSAKRNPSCEGTANAPVVGGEAGGQRHHALSPPRAHWHIEGSRTLGVGWQGKGPGPVILSVHTSDSPSPRCTCL